MYTVNENYRLKKMARLVKGKKTVIDVGFAHKANPYITNEVVIGVDIEAAPTPQNYSEVHTGTLEDFEQTGRQVDAIIAGEILEHFENPAEFLQCCNRLLKKGGVIVLSTPNPNSPIERLLTITLSRRFFYASDHIFLFPQRWLIRLLERCDFGEVKLYSGGFPLPLLGLVPAPRIWCHQTIAIAKKK